MAACSLADKSCNLIYPPIGPYDGNLMLQFDPRKQSERANASNKGFVPKGGCDFSLRITQGSRVVYYMLPASANEADNPMEKVHFKQKPSMWMPDAASAEINGLPSIDKWEHSTQAKRR